MLDIGIDGARAVLTSPPRSTLQHTQKLRILHGEPDRIFERGGRGGVRAEFEVAAHGVGSGDEKWTESEPVWTGLECCFALYSFSASPTWFASHLFSSLLLPPAVSFLLHQGKLSLSTDRPSRHVAHCSGDVCVHSELFMTWHGMAWHSNSFSPIHPYIHYNHTAGPREPNQNAGSNKGGVHWYLVSESRATTTKPMQKLSLIPSLGHQQ